MTDEKDKTWSRSEMSQVRSRPESLVADCSTPALQPPEWRGSQGYPEKSIDRSLLFVLKICLVFLN